jgi:hypothetical protein
MQDVDMQDIMDIVDENETIERQQEQRDRRRSEMIRNTCARTSRQPSEAIGAVPLIDSA